MIAGGLGSERERESRWPGQRSRGPTGPSRRCVSVCERVKKQRVEQSGERKTLARKREREREGERGGERER